MLIPLALLLLLCTLVGSLWSIGHVRAQQEKEALFAVEQITEYFDIATNTLHFLSNGLTLLPSSNKQERLLASAPTLNANLSAIYYLNPNGTTIVWTASGLQENEPPSSPVWSKNKTLSAPFRSDLTGDLSVYLRTGDTPQTIGELNLSGLQIQLAELLQDTPGEAIYLINRDGEVLASFGEDFSRATSTLQASKPATQGEASSPKLQVLPHTTLGATRVIANPPLKHGWHLETTVPIQGTDWLVTLETPLLYALKVPLIWIGLALIVAITSGLSMTRSIRKEVTRNIVVPFTILGQQVESVSQGRYNTTTSELTIPQTFYELSLLIRGFTNMTSALQAREKALAENNAQYRLLIETSPDGIFWLSPHGKIIFCNPQAAKLYGESQANALLGLDITTLIKQEDFEQLQMETQRAHQTGRPATMMLQINDKAGGQHPIEANIALLQDEENPPRGYIIMARDISERQRTLEFNAFVAEITQLALENTDFHALLQEIADRLSGYFKATTCYIALWDSQRNLTIPTVASGMMRSLYPTLAARPKEGTLTDATLKAGDVLAIEDVHHSTLVDPQIAITIPETSFLALPFHSGEQKIGAALIGFQEYHVFSPDEIQRSREIARQISLSLAKVRLLESERRRRQEAEYLSQVTATLTGNLNLPSVLNKILDALAVVLPYQRATIFLKDGNLLQVMAHRNGVISEPQQAIDARNNVLFNVIQSTHHPLVLPDASTDKNFKGWNHTADTRGWMGVPLIANDDIIGFLTLDSLQPDTYGTEEARLAQTFANQVAVAIENARLYQQKNIALERTSTLYRIVRRMISATNLPELLQIIANELNSILAAHACSVLLFNLQNMELEHSAHSTLGHRARSPNIETLLSGLHGEMLQSNMAQIATLSQDEPMPPLLSQMYGSSVPLRSVMTAPLYTGKGIIGSIIVANPADSHPYGHEELKLLTTVAHQSSVAIQNQRLVLDLQKSNQELTLAYDATIEGWSRALELRDRETQGHTMRVTALTVRLAQFVGIDGDQLIHIRRGALLHDIGKIGIPDAILLKPGPLTDEEWEIMKQHPVYAYEMLRHISYLQPALNIPYCHHERWDGSGYPRGLRRTEIPIEARIFAVVDVWDALTSERPYRDGAWDIEYTLSYLHQHSGTLFDSQIVNAFDQMIRSEITSPLHYDPETTQVKSPWNRPPEDDAAPLPD